MGKQFLAMDNFIFIPTGCWYSRHKNRGRLRIRMGYTWKDMSALLELRINTAWLRNWREKTWWRNWPGLDLGGLKGAVPTALLGSFHLENRNFIIVICIIIKDWPVWGIARAARTHTAPWGWQSGRCPPCRIFLVTFVKVSIVKNPVLAISIPHLVKTGAMTPSSKDFQQDRHPVSFSSSASGSNLKKNFVMPSNESGNTRKYTNQEGHTEKRDGGCASSAGGSSRSCLTEPAWLSFSWGGN